MEITRLPDINTSDSEGALREIRSYIVRLDRQLSLLLDNVGEENLSPALKSRIITEAEGKLGKLKNEIIETATFIKEVGDEIRLELQNEYVAKGELGEYTEQALQQITVDGKGITQYFEEMSSISERLNDAETAIDVGVEENGRLSSDISRIKAYIRTGKLEDGVYGIEIGNFSQSEKAPYKVRLSENRLSFFVCGEEVAYFSDNSMFISRASIPNMLKIGNCSVKNDSGICFTCD